MNISTARITPAMKTASDLSESCGQYSQEHPTAGALTNPYWESFNEAKRAAYGSIRVMNVCSRCRALAPRITSLLTTACCGLTTLEIRDPRK